MKTRIFFYIGFACCVANYSSAQQFIYSDSTYYFAPYNQDSLSGIGTIDLGSCTDFEFDPHYAALITDLVFREDSPVCFGLWDGVTRFYQPTFDGGLAYGEEYNQDSLIQGMTCDYYGNFYAAGKGLTILDEGYYFTFTPPQYLGDFPNGMRCGGDLTYRDGNMYMVTDKNELVLVDISNPGQSQILATFPQDILPIEGLVTFFPECDSVITYAFGMTPLVQKAYILNFQDYSLTEYCDYNVHLLGATSFEECTPPDCLQYADLDIDNSSGAFGYGFQADTFCVGSQLICDNDALVFSEIDRIDSMIIQLTGILNPGQEFLQMGYFPDSLDAAGENSPRIKLTNLGGAEIPDFETALKSITYHNAAADPQNGTREVSIDFYTWVKPGASSVCILPLFDLLIQPNLATDTVDCFGQQNGAISIQSISGGTEPYTVTWASGSQAWQIDSLAAGTYHLEIADSQGCERGMEITVPEPDSMEVVIHNTGPELVCDSLGVLMASVSGGNGGNQFVWPDGSTNQAAVNLPSGSYFVSVEDQNGCTAYGEYPLVPGQYSISGNDSICECATFDFFGILLQTDTLICEILTSTGGCDSIVCLNLTVSDTSFFQENAQICSGESYFFEGVEFNSDTSVCFSYSTITGCDSTRCLQLQVLGTITQIEESICPEDTLFFNGQYLFSSGVYRDTVSGFFGCDSITELTLIVFPSIQNIFQTSGILCNGGGVSVFASPGFGSYSWPDGSTGSSIFVPNEGWYSVTITDSNGCSIADSIFIPSLDFSVFIQKSSPYCAGEASGAILIDSIEGPTVSYSFSLDGINFQPSPLFEQLPSGFYQLVVSSDSGCQMEFGIILEDPAPFQVSLGEDKTIFLGETVELNCESNQDFTVTWDGPVYCNTCISNVVQPVETTDYFVEAINDRGCISADQVRIYVLSPEDHFFIPNIFSPNADGQNDVFRISPKPSIDEIFEIEIFDRWGGLTFQASGMNAFWDGTARGKPVPEGAYTGYVRFRLLDGREDVRTFSISVIR